MCTRNTVASPTRPQHSHVVSGRKQRYFVHVPAGGVGATYCCSMHRLSKADVESLLQSYDANPTGSLTQALSVVLGKNLSNWQEAIEQLPSDEFNITALVEEETVQLDALVKRLVENRTL